MIKRRHGQMIFLRAWRYFNGKSLLSVEMINGISFMVFNALLVRSRREQIGR